MHGMCTFCKRLAHSSLYSIQFFFISYSVYIILTFLVKTFNWKICIFVKIVNIQIKQSSIKMITMCKKVADES